MSDSSKTQPDESQPSKSPQTDTRVALINTVQTPLGFFVLVVLIVEVILGITAGFSAGNDRTYLVVGMLVLIFLLVLIVAGMAIFRPTSLYGKPTKSKGQTGSHSETQNETATPKVIKKPRILCASSSPDIFGGMVQEDARIIQRAFPSANFVIEKNLTADRLRELLTTSKFDIVQLTVNVVSDGSIIMNDIDDSIPGEGMVQLLEVSNTSLLILACCNSVPLAAKLATRINMIAAAGNLHVTAFNRWQSVFYQLLSTGVPLSQAYSVAESSIQLPLAILMKQDVVFAKSK